MKHLGDFDASTVIYGKFTTYRPSTGAAYTLGGTPALSVYKDNSTTQSTTGVTLTADFDAVTGLNHFAIDTSADGTFYSAGSFFSIVITTGTVDSVSVVGTVVAEFTIRKNSALKPATAGRTLVVDAAGLADSNVVKIGPSGSGTAQTALNLTGVAVPRILDRLEFQRGQHTVTGATYYVDGTGGNDTTGDGTRALPWKTISKALTAVTSNAHDEIILLPNSGGGPTTITESATINVTKNYVQIRGPGRGVNVTLSTSGGVFNIIASGVQLSGMRITTNSGASSDAVTIASAADFVSVSKCFIENAHRDAVSINVGNNCLIEDCQITGAGRDGVRVSSGAGSGHYNKILRNMFRTIGGSGVNLQGSDASQCRIQGNLIRECTTAGVTIASGVVGTSITDNRFAGNTTNISDSGTGTQHNWNVLTTTLDGYASLNWGDIANKTTANALTGTTIATSQVVASVTGSVGSIATGGITATSFAADAIDAAAIATTAANEIRDAVWAKTLSEETGDPGATPAASSALMLPYMGLRNKRETDSSLGTDKLYNSAGTVILTATVADTGTVFTKAKYA